MEKELRYELSRVSYSIDIMGENISVPVFYSKSSAYMSFFSISREKALRIINSNRLKPINILNGKSLIGITVFDYIDCPVGPYREIALSIPVSVDSLISIPFLPIIKDYFLGRANFFTLLLAMNTEISRDHSGLIFGYPTYDSKLDINIIKGVKNTDIIITETGNDVLAMSFNNSDSRKISKSRYNTVFNKENNLFSVQLHALSYISSQNGKHNDKVRVGFHPITKILNDLEMDPQPIWSFTYSDVTEVLEEPIDLGKLINK